MLREVVESARSLTGARYGFIASVDEGGLPQGHVVSGLSPEEARQMAAWPDAMRLFAHLRSLDAPLRLADFGEYVRSLGLAPGLIPCRSFQGTPMRHRGLDVGSFFLGEKAGGAEFTGEDEEVLVLLAAQAAIAIVNARAHRDERRARADLEALVETSPVGVAVFDAQTVSAPDAPPAEDAPADRPSAPQPQAATAEPEPAPGRTPPPAIGGEGAGWEWINWVRTGLHDGSLPVNAPGAWLHNIEGEAYAVSPACFEAFAAGRDLATATVRHRVVRLRRHRQREAPSGAANLFRAVLADGSRVKGMVFPGELVWDDDPPPRGNARLVSKGR